MIPHLHSTVHQGSGPRWPWERDRGWKWFLVDGKPVPVTQDMAGSVDACNENLT